MCRPAVPASARRALFGAYRNPFTDDPSVAGISRGTANTSVCWLGGKLLALKEAERPMMMIDPDTLDTLGYWDFDGRLTSQTFTAHPKFDAVTGEMIAFGYNTAGVASNDIEIYWITADGVLDRTETFEAPYPSMVHDFSVSERYIAFTICPMVNDWERVQRGEPFFHWDSELPTMIAVIPRAEGVAAIRWYRHPQTVMQTHTFNAWDDGQHLHLDHFITASGCCRSSPTYTTPTPVRRHRSRNVGASTSPFDSCEFTITKLFEHIGQMPVIGMTPRGLRRVSPIVSGSFERPPAARRCYPAERTGTWHCLTGRSSSTRATRCAPTTVSVANSPKGDLNDDAYSEAVRVLGERELFELVPLVGYYANLALQLRVFRVGVPNSNDPASPEGRS